MKRLLFSLLLISMQSALAMDKAEVEDSKKGAYAEYEDTIPVFEHFSLITSIQFYFDQLDQNEGKSRYSFEQKKTSGPQLSEPCRSLEAGIGALAAQKGEEWIECDDLHPFRVKKYHHNGMFEQPVSAIFFECKQEPTADFLRQILPLATDGGPYQMVRVVHVASKASRISSGRKRDLERLAQRIGFSFYGKKGPLEWRRFSEKVFQKKIKRHSPGAAKRNRATGAKRGNSSKR